MTEQILTYILTLLSDRQQASNDDCLEDKSGDYQNSSVLLCTTVVHNDTDIYDQFLKLCWLLVFLRFMFAFVCFSAVVSLCCLLLSCLVSSVLCQEIAWEERLRKDSLCVAWDVKA